MKPPLQTLFPDVVLSPPERLPERNPVASTSLSFLSKCTTFDLAHSRGEMGGSEFCGYVCDTGTRKGREKDNPDEPCFYSRRPYGNNVRMVLRSQAL